MKNIQAVELAEYIKKEALFLDVREEYEMPKFEFANHLSIPTSQLSERFSEIPRDVEVCVYCHSGVRSASVVEALASQLGYDNLINVEGGAVSMALVLR